MPIVHSTEHVAEPDTGGIPEALTELIEELICHRCGEPLSRWEMSAIWPEGGYAVHLPCWAQQPPGMASTRGGRS